MKDFIIEGFHYLIEITVQIDYWFQQMELLKKRGLPYRKEMVKHKYWQTRLRKWIETNYDNDGIKDAYRDFRNKRCIQMDKVRRENLFSVQDELSVLNDEREMFIKRLNESRVAKEIAGKYGEEDSLTYAEHRIEILKNKIRDINAKIQGYEKRIELPKVIS